MVEGIDPHLVKTLKLRPYIVWRDPAKDEVPKAIQDAAAAQVSKGLPLSPPAKSEKAR